MRSLTIALLTGACLLVFAASAYADAVTLVADKDSEIDNALPDDNNGSFWLNIVNWAGGERSIGLVEFDLSGIPTGATVTSAAFGMYQILNGSSGWTYDVFRVTSAWDESTVTYNTAPGVAATASSSLTIGDNSIGLYREWDVTALTQSWVDGTYDNYGMWIEEIPVQGDGKAYFVSSEYSGEAYAPYLSIRYDVVPEPGTLVLATLGVLGLGPATRGRRRR